MTDDKKQRQAMSLIAQFLPEFAPVSEDLYSEAEEEKQEAPPPRGVLAMESEEYLVEATTFSRFNREATTSTA